MKQYPIPKQYRNITRELQLLGKEPNNNYYHTYSQTPYAGRILNEYAIIDKNNNITYSHNKPKNGENLDPIIDDTEKIKPLWWANALPTNLYTSYKKDADNKSIVFDIDRVLLKARPSLAVAKALSKYIKNSNHPKIIYFNLLNRICNATVFNHIPIDISNYNYNQQMFIASPYKLTTLTAVAGSGKTTTIVGRVKQLVADNIPENEILLTTFTKNAANELNERTGIKASTIDSITLNLLSQIYPELSIVTETQFKILTGKDTNIENSDDLFINVMEKISSIEKIISEYKMITYEVATIILIHHILYGLIHTNFKHIIIDEAQDTSLTQMILMLTIALRNNATVSLIGDEAQSLYEFRNAVPQLMHEFKEKSVNYILDTNYRSTDEILAFATKTLQVIPNTDIKCINGINKHGNNVEVKMQPNRFDANSIKPYLGLITNQINSGESVCILTSNACEYTSDDDINILKALQSLGNVNILTSERFNSILESIEKPILNNWNEFIKTNSKMTINIINKLKNPSNTDIKTINDICNNPLNVNKTNFIKAMIAYELTALDNLSQTNEQKKISNSLLNIGTIHSVKGMEFDHTYVFIDETNKHIYDEIPQFYKKEYVAFTRARLSEHIIIRTKNNNGLLTRI